MTQIVVLRYHFFCYLLSQITLYTYTLCMCVHSQYNDDKLSDKRTLFANEHVQGLVLEN